MLHTKADHRDIGLFLGTRKCFFFFFLKDFRRHFLRVQRFAYPKTFSSLGMHNGVVKFFVSPSHSHNGQVLFLVAHDFFWRFYG